eukprot:scaffold15394_cov111-Isochrysis_galbana.AAC.6
MDSSRSRKMRRSRQHPRLDPGGSRSAASYASRSWGGGYVSAGSIGTYGSNPGADVIAAGPGVSSVRACSRGPPWM